MGEHGGVRGVSLAGLGRAKLETKGVAMMAVARERPEAPEPVMPPGFRNFGKPGAANPGDLYAGLDSAWETQTMFAKLARRLAKRHRFKDGVLSDNATNFNPKIPAGYTYFAQFAAHDTIRNSSLTVSLSGAEEDRRNLRERSLLLHTLYGGGPGFSEFLYQVPKKGEGYRTMLRTGPIGKAPANAKPPPEGTCPYPHRDIPRLQQADLSDAVQSGRPDILLPDQRNDDNALVAQVTALFHHIHNAVVTALRALPNMPVSGQSGPKGLYLFENARLVTTALYRSAVRNDLLEKLLLPSVAERYRANGFKPLADVKGLGIPVEFSHAAFRLGHSMVRLSYEFNDEHVGGEGVRDVLRTTSSRRSNKLPPATNWIADWSKFFKIGNADPQFSRRIGPCFNDVMIGNGDFANGLVGPNGLGPLGPAELAKLSAEDRAKLPAANLSGLLLRDLIRGAVGGLLTLDAIIRVLPPGIRKTAPLLVNPNERAKVLRKWLADTDVTFSDEELDHLSTNPPLILWLLFEAAEEANGCSLGTLGSVIIGDVFAAGLSESDDEIESNPMTATLLGLLFPDGAPRTMPGLIKFTAKTLQFENVMPRFLTLPDQIPTA
jgi:hypothetical protein